MRAGGRTASQECGPGASGPKRCAGFEGTPPNFVFAGRGENRQWEDAFVWREDGRFRMIVRDMGLFNHEVGLIMESADGLAWSEPKIACQPARAYFEQPPAPAHLTKYGRFERPQLLLRGERPAYLFTTTQGGRYQTASGFVFRIEQAKQSHSGWSPMSFCDCWFRCLPIRSYGFVTESAVR